METGTATTAAQFPEPLQYVQSLSLAESKAVFAGIGPVIYRFHPDEPRFEPVLDLRSVSWPAIVDRTQAEGGPPASEWLKQAGRTYPITGLAIAPDEKHALAVLGDEIFCYLDLAERACVSCWYGPGPGEGVRMRRPPASQAGSPLRISSDGKWACYMYSPLRDYTSTPEGDYNHVWLFQLPDLELRVSYDLYGTPLAAAGLYALGGSQWLFPVAQSGRIWERDTGDLKRGVTVYSASSWSFRDLVPGPAVQAGFDPDGKTVYFLNRDGQLHLERSARQALHRAGPLFDRRVAKKPYIGSCLSHGGSLALLEPNGELRRYDCRSFARFDVPCNLNLLKIAAGSNPQQYYAIAAADSTNAKARLVEIKVFENRSEAELRVVAAPASRPSGDADGDGGAYDLLATDAGAKHIALSSGPRLIVYETASFRQAHSFRMAKGDVSTISFSPDGSRLLVGSTGGDLYVLRTRDWSEVTSMHNQPAIAHGFGSGTTGQPEAAAFCTADPQRPVQCVNYQAGSTTWTAPRSVGAAASLIEWLPTKGTAAYWVRNKEGLYSLVSAADGQILRTQNAWCGRSPRAEAWLPNHDLVALITDTGNVNICRKENMESILDGQSIGVAGHDLAFNSDGSRVAILANERLWLVETQRWRENPVLRQNLDLLPGEPPIEEYPYIPASAAFNVPKRPK